MRAVLKLLLLATVTLLASAQNWNNYWSLPESYRTHIKKALEKANGNSVHSYHVGYSKLASDPIIESSEWRVHVHLMVTTCKKNANHGHRDECNTQKPKTPWIDCVVCKSEGHDELIDCAKLRDVQQQSEIRNICPTVYRHGGGSIMSLASRDNEPQTGCLGCV